MSKTIKYYGIGAWAPWLRPWM